MRIILTVILITIHMAVLGQVTKSALGLKPLMPSFLRQGDHIECSLTITNNTDKEQTGQAQLELTDSLHTSVDGWFMNTFPNQYFTIDPHGVDQKRFPIQIPYNYEPRFANWKLTARVDSAPMIQNGTIRIIKDSDAAPEVSSKTRIQKRLFRFDQKYKKWIAVFGSEFRLRDSIKVQYVVTNLKHTSTLTIGYPACLMPLNKSLVSVNSIKTVVTDNIGSLTMALPPLKTNTWIIEYFGLAGQLGTFSSGPVYSTNNIRSKNIPIASGISFSIEE